jgi:Domain of unknown function (DUF1707)
MTDEASRPAAGGEVTPRNELRASHQDRDRIVDALRVAAGDGRLTSEELDERVEQALTARTYGELTALVTDLPATPGAAMSVPPKPAKEVVRIDCGSGHIKRDGRWVVPQRMELRVSSGHVKLDFTEAVITQPTLQIDATVRSGHLTLVTKPGIAVDADDVSVRSGHVKVRQPWDPDTPVMLRIDVSGKLSSGHFLARPRRRSFWQWLRRAPRPYEISAS